jgi:DNA-binding response OmpR family regulator
LSRPTVLLVEDDEATLQMYASALRDEFRVFVARDAAQASAVAEELDWDADVLVVDLLLGDGPRGDQFVTTYRERAKRRTPVIVVSGASGAYETAQAIRPQTILSKPVEIDDLARQVHLFLGYAGPRDGAAELP